VRVHDRPAQTHPQFLQLGTQARQQPSASW
jgi:hypothetical protein